MRLGALAAALTVAALACTRPLDEVATALDGGGGGGKGGADDGHGGGGAGAAPGGGAPVSTCEELPFLLVGAANQVHAFYPTGGASKLLGTLDCAEAKTAAVLSAAEAADGTAYFLLEDQQILVTKAESPTTCELWGKSPADAAQAIAFNGGAKEQLLIAAKGDVYAADPPAQPSSWAVLGSLPAADLARALLGTGDGRLFAALSPSVGEQFRIAKLDLAGASASVTFLVPAPGGTPDDPAGFALHADELLIFSGKSLTRYDFASGSVGAPEVLPDLEWPIVAVAAPACASTAP